MVTITGTLTNAVDGTPHTGPGFIEPTVPVILDAGNQQVRLAGQPFELDEDGAFEIDVPDPNDPTLNPTGYTYRVGIRPAAGDPLEVVFSVPSGATTLDLADITPVTATAGIPITRGEKGDTGAASTVPGPPGPVFSTQWAPAEAGLNAAPGAGTLSAFAEFVVDPDGTTIHQFAMVNGASPGIYHATSTDGDTFTFDAARILAPGTEDWENLTVGVPTVWCEAGTWHMLYRGTGNGTFTIGIGYATAPAAAGPWTRVQSSPSYVIGGAGNAVEAGPGRVIKVDGTYVLHASGTGGERAISVYTSTDLVTWTKDPASPVWRGGRFCNSIWKDGDLYYSLVPHYRGAGMPGVPADIELWRSTTPQFYANTRENLGTILKCGPAGTWSEANLDTPTVLTTDITKSAYPSFAGGSLWIYHAGQTPGNVWRSGLVKRDALPLVGQLPEAIPPAPTTIPFQWAMAALPANKSLGRIWMLGDATTTIRHATLPFSCDIVGLIITSSAARSAGSATANVVDTAGAIIPTAPVAALTTGAATTMVATVPVGQCHLAAGTQVGVTLASSGWAPTTANIIVSLVVAFDRT